MREGRRQESVREGVDTRKVTVVVPNNLVRLEIPALDHLREGKKEEKEAK